MRRRADEIVGGFVKEEKGGLEHIHTCKTCGENKLSVNQENFMYHCWHCGVGGRLRMDHTYPVHAFHRDQAISKDSDAYTKILKQADADTDFKVVGEVLQRRGVGRNVIDTFHLCLEPASKKNIVLPMYLGGRPSGYQCYRPLEGKGHRYLDEGQKGIAGEDIRGSCLHVVLIEGMFDAFKIWEVVEESWPKKARFVQCLCGNQISDPQMAELLFRVPETATIHIAFDNDKLSAAVKAYNLIRPYRNVHVAFPPETLGKDWDEAFGEDAAWSKRFWVLKLKGD